MLDGWRCKRCVTRRTGACAARCYSCSRWRYVAGWGRCGRSYSHFAAEPAQIASLFEIRSNSCIEPAPATPAPSASTDPLARRSAIGYAASSTTGARTRRQRARAMGVTRSRGEAISIAGIHYVSSFRGDGLSSIAAAGDSASRRVNRQFRTDSSHGQSQSCCIHPIESSEFPCRR